jgi:radical SAM superfamily enzyme with C-terminal helix-hairpin-helix motif
MSVNTKTLSVRVPLDVANRIENLCLQRNINRNQLLQECIASEGGVGIKNFSNGGSAEPMPEILTDLLIGVGSLATGTVVYHLLFNNLPKSWSEETREMVSIVSAISSGFAMAYGLEKATRK